MNGDVKMREQLSAFVDDELMSVHCADVVAFADSDEGRAAWRDYQLIGDVLRASELARKPSCDLVSRLREQLAQEARPATLERGETVQVALPVREVAVAAAGVRSQPSVVSHERDAANHDVFRWKMVAGFASLAAVATIGWNAYTGLTLGGSQSNLQLASAPAAVVVPGEATTVAVNVPVQGLSNANGQQAVMIRDPRLDELLAAHKQYGSTSALQMPAGFLRNATFEAPAR